MLLMALARLRALTRAETFRFECFDMKVADAGDEIGPSMAERSQASIAGESSTTSSSRLVLGQFRTEEFAEFRHEQVVDEFTEQAVLAPRGPAALLRPAAGADVHTNAHEAAGPSTSHDRRHRGRRKAHKKSEQRIAIRRDTVNPIVVRRAKEDVAEIPILIAGDVAAGKSTFLYAVTRGDIQLQQCLRHYRTTWSNLWLRPTPAAIDLLLTEMGGRGDSQAASADARPPRRRAMGILPTELCVASLLADTAEVTFFLDDDEFTGAVPCGGATVDDAVTTTPSLWSTVVAPVFNWLHKGGDWPEHHATVATDVPSAAAADALRRHATEQHTMLHMIEIGGHLNTEVARRATQETPPVGTRERVRASDDASWTSLYGVVEAHIARASTLCYFVNAVTAFPPPPPSPTAELRPGASPPPPADAGGCVEALLSVVDNITAFIRSKVLTWENRRTTTGGERRQGERDRPRRFVVVMVMNRWSECWAAWRRSTIVAHDAMAPAETLRERALGHLSATREVLAQRRSDAGDVCRSIFDVLESHLMSSLRRSCDPFAAGTPPPAVGAWGAMLACASMGDMTIAFPPVVHGDFFHWTPSDASVTSPSLREEGDSPVAVADGTADDVFAVRGATVDHGRVLELLHCFVSLELLSSQTNDSDHRPSASSIESGGTMTPSYAPLLVRTAAFLLLDASYRRFLSRGPRGGGKRAAPFTAISAPLVARWLLTKRQFTDALLNAASHDEVERGGCSSCCPTTSLNIQSLHGGWMDVQASALDPSQASAKAIQPWTSLLVHLMSFPPIAYIDAFQEARAWLLSRVHEDHPLEPLHWVKLQLQVLRSVLAE